MFISFRAQGKMECGGTNRLEQLVVDQDINNNSIIFLDTYIHDVNHHD